jgi:hypothetical protein
MATIRFTPQLERFLECPVGEVPGDTVEAVLDHVFREHPRLRSYIVDDQGRLRLHVALFIDGTLHQDRDDLSVAVGDQTDLQIWQALSGG